MRPVLRPGLIALVVAAVFLGSAGIVAAQLPTPPPPNIPPLPKGKTTSCTTKGPKWVAGPGHGQTQGPTREGHLYLVHAWGISCSHARKLLRAFFPKMPVHPTGKLRGGPDGYRCTAVDPPGTKSITNLHNGQCVRLDPAATFDWGPKGRGKPGPYVVLR